MVHSLTPWSSCSCVTSGGFPWIALFQAIFLSLVLSLGTLAIPASFLHCTYDLGHASINLLPWEGRRIFISLFTEVA